MSGNKRAKKTQEEKEEAKKQAIAMKPDEATVAFWRLRRGLAKLPLEVRLRILFWWVLDHLHLFESDADVSVLTFCLLSFFV